MDEDGELVTDDDGDAAVGGGEVTEDEAVAYEVRDGDDRSKGSQSSPRSAAADEDDGGADEYSPRLLLVLLSGDGVKRRRSPWSPAPTHAPACGKLGDENCNN